MKILLVADTEQYGSLGYYHKHALEQAGHELICYDYTRFYSRFAGINFLRRRAGLLLAPVLRKIEREVLGLVEVHAPDMLLTIKGELITRELLLRIRELRRIPRVNWFADPVPQLFNPPHVLLEALTEYDYFFVKDEYFLNEVRLISPRNTHFLPGGYDHAVYRPLQESPDLKCDVAFAGSKTPKRVAILSQIADLGLRIYGKGWDSLGRRHALARCCMGYPIFGEEHARLFCSARINVNIHSPMEGFGINHRAFEIAGAGGFQLVDWRYGLERYFEPDREIVTFRTPGELREKAEHFLTHPEERAAIARQGHEKARAQFTMEKKFQELLGIVGSR